MEKLLWPSPSATAFMCDVFVISQHGKRLGKGEQEETTSRRKNQRERMGSGSGSALAACPGVNCAICSCLGSSAHTSLSLLTAPRAALPLCWRVLLAGPRFLGSDIPVLAGSRAALGSPLRHPQSRGFAPRGWKVTPSPPLPPGATSLQCSGSP